MIEHTKGSEAEFKTPHYLFFFEIKAHLFEL